MSNPSYLNEHMNPANPATEQAEDSVACFYQQAVNASQIDNLEDLQNHLDWAAGIQEQVIGHIARLSSRASIHRNLGESGDTGLEFIAAEYETLISFLADVGTSVTEMTSRLRAARYDIDKANSIATQQILSSPLNPMVASS